MIRLGVLTDHSGPFASMGWAVAQGRQLFWDGRNAGDGVCGRKVEFVVRDHGYNTDRAVAAYREVEGSVLAMDELLGAPMITALQSRLEAERMLSFARSFSSALLANPYVVVTGATYDVEAINGIQWLGENKNLRRGHKLGPPGCAWRETPPAPARRPRPARYLHPETKRSYDPAMAYDDALAERLRDRLSGVPTITEKKMFGGLAFLEHGNMTVGVIGDDLVVRIGPGDMDAALARPGAREFDFTGRPMKGWLMVSGDELDDEPLDGWIEQARAFVATLPPK